MAEIPEQWTTDIHPSGTLNSGLFYAYLRKANELLYSRMGPALPRLHGVDLKA